MSTKKQTAPAEVASTTETQPEEGLIHVPAQEIEVVRSLDDMFASDAGGGLANMKSGDFATPFMSILQKGSPQVSRANPKYIKGAEQGMIMNTITSELYSGETGIAYIPCGYSKLLVRWKPRDSGGGLVCQHLEGDPALQKCKRNERGQLFDPETNDIIVDTAYHFGLMVNGSGFPEFSLISMASTQLKKSRNWNTVMKRVMKKASNGAIYNPPSYSHIYRLTTVGEAKDSYDWYGWKIVIESEISDVNLYKIARDFAKEIEAGNVKVSAPPSDFDESEAGNGTVTDDSVPF